MCVFEVSGIFESVAHDAVQGDVGDPDEGDCREGGAMEVERYGEDDKRRGVGMGDVVDSSACARAGEIAEHEEIRGEEEDCEEQPGEVQVRVGDQDCGEDEGVFELEEEGRTGEHDAFIRDEFGGMMEGPQIPFDFAQGRLFDSALRASLWMTLSESVRRRRRIDEKKEEAATGAASSFDAGLEVMREKAGPH
jgi:hypothetical protein